AAAARAAGQQAAQPILAPAQHVLEIGRLHAAAATPPWAFAATPGAAALVPRHQAPTLSRPLPATSLPKTGRRALCRVSIFTYMSAISSRRQRGISFRIEAATELVKDERRCRRGRT